MRFYDFFQGVCGKSHICRVSVEEMELLPCVARPTTVSGRETSSAARGSINV
jgi:hypothetical protein